MQKLFADKVEKGVRLPYPAQEQTLFIPLRDKLCLSRSSPRPSNFLVF